MNSSWSVFVQILSVIVVLTIAITLMIALFSYIGYKVRQRKKPAVVAEEIPDFLVRYNADMFLSLGHEGRVTERAQQQQPQKAIAGP